jgi:shikimate dehydrogenase
VKIHVNQIESFYQLIDIFNIKGVSATVPHKEAILKKANDEHWLHKVGAANTIIKNDDHWKIDNTDIAAAIESIESLLQVDKPKVLILGAGGAAKGLAWGMARKGWKLTICNRSIEKAQSLCDQLNAELLAWDDRNAHGFDVVVNCTILGMQPNEDTTPLEFDGSHNGLIAFDTVYTPANTRFLKEAKEVGAFGISGREMFYRQAAIQHSLWFNTAPPFQAMSDIMDKINESEN